ncbi:CAP domain-containing protein [Mycolicibacterium vaccae]|uniref:CAP domain-containing protein n=1 Tax=Mycolicibacterium vaccae TaxID=1810 RepID=UPI003CFC408B
MMNHLTTFRMRSTAVLVAGVVLRRRLTLVGFAVVIALVTPLRGATAHADNKRLNASVLANVYTVQRQAGCDTDIKADPQLRLAAQWHTNDLLHNRSLVGDVGSDGSTPQDRANAAGFRGTVAQTVAINPALAISGIELINRWYHNPDYYAIMSDCDNAAIGVWSENSLDRTVVVAVYGTPQL